MGEETKTQVAIVGGGPVGLVLALFLDFHGARCTIFNTEPESRWHPKGNGQNARTMEHYRRLGFSDEVRRLGLPGDHPFDQAYFTRLSSHEIYRFPMPSRDERIAMRSQMPVTDQLPEPMFHVNQMYVERYLLERVRKLKSVDVRFGWQVDWFTQNENGVRLHASKAGGSDEVICNADYAVACDGGNGFIRKTLGIAYEGDVQKKDAYWAGQFFSIYMRIPEFYAKAVGDRRAWMYWAINPDPHTRGVIFTLNGIDEFMMLIKPERGHSGVDTAQVTDWLKRTIGVDIAVEILAYHPWNAGQALVAERYRAGRIFIAGDAAHLFTPTGGFGMNTGIDDSANLAWKLAAALAGWGGPGLLDSYEAERKPIGLRNTGASRKYASRMHDAVVPEEIESDGPAGEAARAAAAQMTYVRYNHFNRDEDKDAVGVQLGSRYDGSPIIVADGEPPPEVFPQTYDNYVPSGLPGGRAPHLWLDDRRVMGSSLFDRLGRGFTLLRFDAAADIATLERAAAARGIPFEVLDLTVPEGRELYGCDLVLVRPDQYIAWRGDRLPEDADALLARVTGF